MCPTPETECTPRTPCLPLHARLLNFLRKCSCRHWTRQEGDLQLGDAYCGNSVTTACGLVPEPSKGKGVYSLLYTASGTCSTKTCDHENVCRAYLVNEAEAEP